MIMEIMDVTLRESIYIPNNKITIEAAQRLVKGLSSAGIDYIEIGYVSTESSNNLQEYCPIQYIEALKEAKVKNSRSKLAVMVHPHLFNDDVLNRIVDAKIEMVRLCIPYNKAEEVSDIVKVLKENGVTVAANLIRASCLSINEIVDFAIKMQNLGVDYSYLADSNGAMIPEEVKQVYNALYKNVEIELGFHPHNNMQLASANAIEAVNAGARIIDSSIYGYGKGMANLCTESFVATVQQMNKCKYINFDQIILTVKNAYEDFLSLVCNDMFEIRANSLVSGYKNINLDNQKELMNLAKKENMSLLDLLLQAKGERIIKNYAI